MKRTALNIIYQKTFIIIISYYYLSQLVRLRFYTACRSGTTLRAHAVEKISLDDEQNPNSQRYVIHRRTCSPHQLCDQRRFYLNVHAASGLEEFTQESSYLQGSRYRGVRESSKLKITHLLLESCNSL